MRIKLTPGWSRGFYIVNRNNNITMKTWIKCLIICLLLGSSTGLRAQDEPYQRRIRALQEEKQRVTNEEKDALKEEVKAINEAEEEGRITPGEAKQQKEEAAKRRALNIENRIAIIDNKIALLERNKSIPPGEESEFSITDDGADVHITFGDEDWFRFHKRNRKPKYDRWTYSDPVIAFGLNNAVIDGQSLNDSPYKIGGSRFFELGWAWRTRVFRNSNFMRFHYGVSLQFNGLKPDNNQYFVSEGGQTFLETFDYNLDKSKFRMDNLVFPVHLEFGPSKFHQYSDHVRYSLNNQFRFGIGGYGGFNMSTRQKLKYERNGDHVKDKLKRGYNTNDLIYGLSAYLGFDNVLLYMKYDLNPIFKNAQTDQHMIGIGLRIDR